MISTNIAPVTVLPASLIDVIYAADSLANKSVDAEAAEKPLAVPLALSTTLDSTAPGGFAKANPAVLEEAKEGKLVSALLSLVLPAKAVLGSSSL